MWIGPKYRIQNLQYCTTNLKMFTNTHLILNTTSKYSVLLCWALMFTFGRNNTKLERDNWIQYYKSLVL